MSNVISFADAKEKIKEKKEAEPDLEVRKEYWEEIAQQNSQAQERLRQERLKANESVKKSHRLKK